MTPPRQRPERTFVMLHPYGTTDGFLQKYAGTKPARVKASVDSAIRCGWAGSVHVVKARTLKEAVDKLGRRLYGEPA